LRIGDENDNVQTGEQNGRSDTGKTEGTVTAETKAACSSVLKSTTSDAIELETLPNLEEKLKGAKIRASNGSVAAEEPEDRPVHRIETMREYDGKLELALDEIINLAKRIGFELVQLPKDEKEYSRVGFVQDTNSMLQNIYYGHKLVMRKVAPPTPYMLKEAAANEAAVGEFAAEMYEAREAEKRRQGIPPGFRR
jgi:hypothetical protein